MSFTWTKVYRSYDTDKFTGFDSGVDGDPNRYSFTKEDGTKVTTDNVQKFLFESDPSFLGYHTNDMRAAFPFTEFNDLQEARVHFNLMPHPVHVDRVKGTSFELRDKHSIKMTIQFPSKQVWQEFVEINHDATNPITHGMKEFKSNFEYDKDYISG